MSNPVWQPRGIPLWLKLAYTAWLLVWIPTSWSGYGAINFLWLCDVANLIIGVAIWLESPLLFSSQAVSVLIIQIVWMIDFFAGLTLGLHPIGGTEYMFDDTYSLPLRLTSLFHVFVPVLLIWAVRRLGYDHRGWKLQTGICTVILPISYLLGNEELNLNWLWKPFEIPQTLVPAYVYLFFAMAGYPVILYLTTHFVLARTMPSRKKV